MQEGSNILALSFDSVGNYTGFDSINWEKTIESAIEDGCYVRKDSHDVGGLEFWYSFIQNSNEGIDSAIRIMNIFDDSIFYTDLFFINGYYRVFDSSSVDLYDHKYRFMLELNGKTLNSENGNYYMLTDYKALTFSDVSESLHTSNSEIIASIPQFRFVLLG
jgi:hypothetical protein